MLVKDLFTAFVEWNERHRAPATVRFYRQRLAAFLERFGDRPFCAPLDEEHPETGITSLEIDEYLSLAGEGLSDSTRRHNVVALATLQSFAVKQKLLKYDRQIFHKLEKPPMGRRERIPTEEERQKLLEWAPPSFRRIYLALSQCGARPGELCGLLIVGHIDWEKGKITLLDHKTARKTGKPREINVAGKFRKMLLDAIDGRTEGHVFLNARQRPWTVGALSSMHRRLRDRAKLDKALVLYSTRHRYATEMLRREVPLKDVADMMGHRSVTTTERYTHRDISELRDKQDLID